jgi:hypothetical protein
LVYQWFLNGVAIPNANLDLYTPTQSGSYTVVATNNAGCSGTSPAYNFVSSIDELEIQALIYPNPASHTLWVKLEQLPIGQVQAELLDVAGRRVLLQTSEATQELQLPLINLANGSYTLRLLTSNGTLIHRVQLVH